MKTITPKWYAVRISKESYERLLEMAREQRRTLKATLDLLIQVKS